MKQAGRENKVAVIVGTITNDVRLYDIPNLKVNMPFFFVKYYKVFSWWITICGYGIDL